MGWLAWDGMQNVRDLGGLPLERGGHTRGGVVIRSAELDRVRPAGLEAIRALHPARVIDLRSPFEIASVHPLAAEPFFRALPWIDPVRDGERDPALERTKADVYIGSLERNRTHIAAIVHEIADTGMGPVVVHCKAGTDRTGMLCALLLQVAGVVPEAIVRDYLASAHQPGAAASPGPAPGPELPAALRPITADTMRETLSHVADAYGGAAGYLRCSGVSPDALARIRVRLTGGT